MSLEFPEIDPRGAAHPFAQIADWYEKRIRAGRLKPGAVLPSENEIMRGAGVGRSTVRRAMARLRDKGLVETIAMRGTYVARDIPDG